MQAHPACVFKFSHKAEDFTVLKQEKDSATSSFHLMTTRRRRSHHSMRKEAREETKTTSITFYHLLLSSFLRKCYSTKISIFIHQNNIIIEREGTEATEHTYIHFAQAKRFNFRLPLDRRNTTRSLIFADLLISYQALGLLRFCMENVPPWCSRL